MSFLIATGVAVLAAIIVAVQLNSRSCQQELARQQPEPAKAPPYRPPRRRLRKS